MCSSVFFWKREIGMYIYVDMQMDNKYLNGFRRPVDISNITKMSTWYFRCQKYIWMHYNCYAQLSNLRNPSVALHNQWIHWSCDTDCMLVTFVDRAVQSIDRVTFVDVTGSHFSESTKNLLTDLRPVHTTNWPMPKITLMPKMTMMLKVTSLWRLALAHTEIHYSVSYACPRSQSPLFLYIKKVMLNLMWPPISCKKRDVIYITNASFLNILKY